MSVLNAPPREGLIRAASGGLEVRAAGAGEPARLGGHFSVFDTWTEINSAWEGNFLERIAPGAFRKTFREKGTDGIKLLLEHGQDPQVGQKPLGRFTSLTEDETGARYEADLYDTPYVNDLLPALRDGMYGASFRFRVIREDINESPEPSDHNPKGLPERTIKEASVAEAGPVLWGAYPEATSQARSLTDEFAFRRFMDLSPDELTALADFWRQREAAAPEPTEDLPVVPVEGDDVSTTEPVADVEPEADADPAADEPEAPAEDAPEVEEATDLESAPDESDGAPRAAQQHPDTTTPASWATSPRATYHLSKKKEQSWKIP